MVDVEEVLPVEDLVREHGVLRRILLIYGAAIMRLEGGAELDPTVVSGAAGALSREFPHYRTADLPSGLGLAVAVL